MGIAEPYIDTNIDRQTLLTIGKGLLPGQSDMETLRIPIADSYEDKRVEAGSVLSIDFEKNKQALQEFLTAENETGIAGAVEREK